MNTADLYSIVFVILAALIAMPCIAMVYQTYFPRFAKRAEERVTKRPILTFFAGAVGILLNIGVVLLLTLGGAPGKFLSVIAGLGGVWVALSGLTGIAARIGRATSSPYDEGRPWRATVRGSIVLECACLFPGLGWLLIYPMALVTGYGAAALALFKTSSEREAGRFVQAPPAGMIYAAPPPMAAPAASSFAMAGPEEMMHR